MLKIALVEPPATKMVMRDMYSSTVSKLGYSWPNVDLLALSGILRNEYDCKIFDFNARGLNKSNSIEEIKLFNPNHIIFSFGQSNATEDLNFAKVLKSEVINSSGKIFGTGGTLIHNITRFMNEQDWLDGIILNYVYNSIGEYLSGSSDLYNIAVRRNDGSISLGDRLNAPKEFHISPALHEDLCLDNYFLPQIKTDRFTSIATSWGCPYKCSFCVSSSLSYVARSSESIFEEIKYCNRLGINGFFFRDNVFGINKKQIKSLGDLISSSGMDIKFISDARIDYVDEETVYLYKRIGAGALNFGIETFNNETLIKHQKNLKNNNSEYVLSLCKENNIVTTGYFILGLPGETEDDVKKTIDYACKLPLSYASFNLPIPIEGSKLRETSVKDGLIEDKYSEYDGIGQSFIPNKNIEIGRMRQLHKLAYVKFYLRISIISFIINQNLNLSKIKKLFKALFILFSKFSKT